MIITYWILPEKGRLTWLDVAWLVFSGRPEVLEIGPGVWLVSSNGSGFLEEVSAVAVVWPIMSADRVLLDGCFSPGGAGSCLFNPCGSAFLDGFSWVDLDWLAFSDRRRKSGLVTNGLAGLCGISSESPMHKHWWKGGLHRELAPWSVAKEFEAFDHQYP